MSDTPLGRLDGFGRVETITQQDALVVRHATSRD